MTEPSNKKPLIDYASCNTYDENSRTLVILSMKKFITIVRRISSILNGCIEKSSVLAEFTFLGNSVVDAAVLCETELENKDYFIKNIILSFNPLACMLIKDKVAKEYSEDIASVIETTETEEEMLKETNLVDVGKIVTIIIKISSLLKNNGKKNKVLETLLHISPITDAAILCETGLWCKDSIVERIITCESVRACILIAGIADLAPEYHERAVRVISERGTEAEIEMFESVYPGEIKKSREKMNQLIKNFHVPVNLEDNSLYE